jgi:hypothetical protein
MDLNNVMLNTFVSPSPDNGFWGISLWMFAYVFIDNKQGGIEQASAVTIAEIKDKVTTLSKEVEQFQGEVLYKEKVLAKMRVDLERAVKGRGVIRGDITKCTQVVKAKKVCVLYSPLTSLST